MNIQAYTATAAVIILAGCLAVAPCLDAQTTFTIPLTATQSSPAATFQIDSFGTLSETAPTSSSATFTFSGSPQLVWLPALNAFRAGSFGGSQTTVGQLSAAFGSGTASGTYSFATGYSSAKGFESAAFGYSTASGDCSFAAGVTTTASGYGSTAVGEYSLSSGSCTVATGFGTMAISDSSTAIGNSTMASGNRSTATGSHTTANSYASFVTGQYNTGLSSTAQIPSATTWVATDPLFEVGNGLGWNPTPKSDALIVYKNGNATLQGVLTAAAGGDIPMYTGH